MKPYPIPVLEDEAADEFIRDIENGPSELEKEVMKRAKARFAKPKKKKKQK